MTPYQGQLRIILIAPDEAASPYREGIVWFGGATLHGMAMCRVSFEQFDGNEWKAVEPAYEK